VSSVSDFLNYRLIHVQDYSLYVWQLLLIIAIFIFTKLLLLGLKVVLNRAWKRRHVDRGTRFAIFQIIRYVAWFIALIAMLQLSGVHLTVLLAGGAALLVAIGLGLQTLFIDLVSGFVILVEGTIKVDDVIEVDGDVVRVKRIGLRTSKVQNRDDIILILPNSKIANNKVINWSHNQFQARFRVNVSVAYGSDIDLVMKVLAESAAEHPNCNHQLPPKARLVNFGDSGLVFELLFYSENLFRIEQTKADIRAIITKKFRAHQITIPLPQRDLHLKPTPGSKAEELFPT
jgi:small-conductance mechanosensitive channel